MNAPTTNEGGPMATTNIQALSATLKAMANCERSGNAKWLAGHRETIASILGLAPSGSGIDCGTVLDEGRTKPGKITFVVEYHRMDEHGLYCGWRTYRVQIRPTFSGIDVAVTGRGDEATKKYLADVYREWSLMESREEPYVGPAVDAPARWVLTD